MNTEYYLGLMAFTFAASITPGPNNLMLLASGLNHGVRRSLPHYFGVVFGILLLTTIVGLGFGALLTEFPEAFMTIKVLGVFYLVFLAWKIANAGRQSASDKLKKPLSFFQATAFQWVNPKAWVMAVTVVTAFTVQDKMLESVATVSLAYSLACLFCPGLWLVAGQSLQQFLKENKRLRFFNISMAVLLVASIIPMAL
ncbi:LysE family translocator [Porticoccaceae bacterium]|nr:LysE family translocator [Porticoccaceae bacterium]